MAIVLAAVKSVSWQICEGMNYLVTASPSSVFIASKNAAFAFNRPSILLTGFFSEPVRYLSDQKWLSKTEIKAEEGNLGGLS